ncbi:hypothetical protein LCGC14_2714500 [marine sediment metagenome]|uniref:Uncharacterized protein n=1 Tax=marine sediment metagenome TaxID=412755 RepID=A0A0F8ZZK8_9ZZZZ
MVEISIDKPTGGDTPLRHFKGTLAPDKELQEERQTKDGSRKYVVVNFNFLDLEVIDSVEPFPFPIALVTIGYAPPKVSRGSTKWEAFSASLRKLMPDNPDIELLKGKRQEWKMENRSLRRGLTDEETGQPVLDGNNNQIWGDVPTLCWTVVSVEGLGSVQEADDDFNAYLVALADGKTEPKFYEVALTDSKVMSRPNIVEAIIGRKLLDTLKEMNLLTRDAEGFLHKVTGDVPVVVGDVPVTEPSA